MSFSITNLIPVQASTESIGWGTSAVVHIIGAIVALSTVSTEPSRTPRLSGDVTRVELMASWSVPKSVQNPVEPQQVDYHVTIMPDRATVAERTYRRTRTNVSKPTDRELEIVKRLAKLPPPKLDRHERATRKEIQIEPKMSKLARASRQSLAKRVPTPQVNLSSISQDSSVGVSGKTPPEPLENRPPTYPAQAVADRLEGTVTLRVSITPDGRVDKLEIATSSGHSILDAAATSAVRDWRFIPAKQSGQPVAIIVYLPIRFVLD